MASAVDEVSAILGLSQGSDSVPDDLKSPEQHQVSCQILPICNVGLMLHCFSI